METPANQRWLGILALVVVAVAGVWMVNAFRRPGGASLLGGAPTASAPGPGDETITSIKLFRTPGDLPAFSMNDIDGHTINSSDLRGKVVFMNFWATWCGPCRMEIPDLIALQKKYSDKIAIIGVSEDEIPVEDVRKFATEQKMNYPIVMTNPELRRMFHGVVALPTTFVLDKEGKLIQKHVGILQKNETEVEARVLAGLDTTTKVELIDDEKTRLKNLAQAKSIPGIELAHLTDTQRQAAVQALIAEDCTCGCGLTLAECRMDDPTCPVSLPLAQEIVKKYSASP